MVPEISLTPQLESRFLNVLVFYLIFGIQKFLKKKEKKFGIDVI